MDEGYSNEILAQCAMQRLTPEQRLAAALRARAAVIEAGAKAETVEG